MCWRTYRSRCADWRNFPRAKTSARPRILPIERRVISSATKAVGAENCFDAHRGQVTVGHIPYVAGQFARRRIVRILAEHADAAILHAAGARYVAAYDVVVQNRLDFLVGGAGFSPRKANCPAILLPRRRTQRTPVSSQTGIDSEREPVPSRTPCRCHRR